MLAAKSKDWLTEDAIENSPLDAVLKCVYYTHLSQLQETLSSSGQRTVEQFVAAEGMDELTLDFQASVAAAKVEEERRQKEVVERDKEGEREEEDKGLRKRIADSARLWARFREMDRGMRKVRVS